jgi:hypothetical protein
MAFRINKDLLDREVKKIKQVIKNNPNNPLKNMSDYLIRVHVERDLINDQRLKNGLEKKKLVKPISKIINTEVIRMGKTETVKMRVEEDYLETTCGYCKKKFNYLKDRKTKRPRLFCSKYCSSNHHYKSFIKRKAKNEAVGLPANYKEEFSRNIKETIEERVEYFKNLTDADLGPMHRKQVEKIRRKYGVELFPRWRKVNERLLEEQRKQKLLLMKQNEPDKYKEYVETDKRLRANLGPEPRSYY